MPPKTHSQKSLGNLGSPEKPSRSYALTQNAPPTPTKTASTVAPSTPIQTNRILISVMVPTKIDFFNLIDQHFTDMVVNFDRRTLKLHSYIINCRSPEMIPFLFTIKVKKNSAIYETKLIDYEMCIELMRYIYSDQANFSKLPILSVGVLSRVGRLNNLPHFADLCDAHIESNLSMDNIYEMLSFSSKYALDGLEGICLKFAVMNHGDFITNPELRKKLTDVALLQRESILHTKFLSNSSADVLSKFEITSESTLSADFSRLLENGLGHDAMFTIGNISIPCHRAILYYTSPFLTNIFEQNMKIKPPVVIPFPFPSVSPSALMNFLRHIYYRLHTYTLPDAFDLLIVSKLLQLPALFTPLKGIVSQHINLDTLSAALTIAYNPVFKDDQQFQVDLRSRCFEYLLHHFYEFDITRLQHVDPLIPIHILLYLQLKVPNITPDAVKASSKNPDLGPIMPIHPATPLQEKKE